VGVLLSLITDTGEEPPIAYSPQVDPKEFCWQVTKFSNRPDSEIRLLVDHFDLDLEPLAKLSGEEFTLDAWMSPHVKITGDWDQWTDEMKLEAWQKHKGQIDASYQDPQDLVIAIAQLAQALEDNPDIYKALGIEDQYFLNGTFLLHLKDLGRKAEWTRNHGYKKVRLLVS